MFSSDKMIVEYLGNILNFISMILFCLLLSIALSLLLTAFFSLSSRPIPERKFRLWLYTKKHDDRD